MLPTFNANGELSDVDLYEKEISEDQNSSVNEKSPAISVFGLFAPAAVSAVSSIDKFRQFYEVCVRPVNTITWLTFRKSLSDSIVKHYMAAGQTKSGESILGDLAALRLYVDISAFLIESANLV